MSGTPRLDGIKTLTRNEDVKQSTCSGKYSIIYNGKSHQFETEYALSYLEDKKETEVRVNVSSIQVALMALGMKERPIKNGTETIWDQTTGNVKAKIEWKNGVQDGLTEIYNSKNGKLITQFQIKNGKKDGPEKGWDRSGEKLLVDLVWKDGNATGVEKRFDANTGRVLIDYIWKNGKQTGLAIKGSLLSNYAEYHVKDGVLDGAYKKYAVGREVEPYLEEIRNYKMGKLDGEFLRYSPNGEIISKRYYKDDVEALPALNGQTINANSSRITACLDSKINALRKELGEESVIHADELNEWEIECTQQ